MLSSLKLTLLLLYRGPREERAPRLSSSVRLPLSEAHHRVLPAEQPERGKLHARGPGDPQDRQGVDLQRLRFSHEKRVY